MIRAFHALLLSLAVCALGACGQGDNDPGLGGVTVSDARALDRAAARIEERRGPMPDAAGPAPAATAPPIPAPAPAPTQTPQLKERA